MIKFLAAILLVLKLFIASWVAWKVVESDDKGWRFGYLMILLSIINSLWR